MSYFLFPFHLAGKGSRIILYGAGAVMRDFVDQIRATDYCEILFAVDRDYMNKLPYKRVKVVSPDEILTAEYDKIVVAVSEKFTESVTANLLELEVPDNKVIKAEKKPVNCKNPGQPNKVRIDASTVCQLKCKSCNFQRHGSDYLGKGFLSFKNFKKFVDNHKWIENIELASFGEIFLNPEIYDIIKYAYEEGVVLTACGGANFNSVTDEVLEALVKYKFQHIHIGIDGASQEVYSKYRVGGNFDAVITNIKKLLEYKHKYKSTLPNLTWQYVLMSQTESDVIKAKEMAKELGIPILFKLTWDSNTHFEDPEMLKRETGLDYLSRDEYKEKTKTTYLNCICHQLFDAPVINWDGRLLGCCAVMDDDFGVNVFEVGLTTALESPNYALAKQMVTGKAFPLENSANIPCANCFYYKDMLANARFVKI